MEKRTSVTATRLPHASGSCGIRADQTSAWSWTTITSRCCKLLHALHATSTTLGQPFHKHLLIMDSNNGLNIAEFPTLFNPATCTRKGLCPVSSIRNKGDPFEKHSLYFEQHGTGPEKILFIMG